MASTICFALAMIFFGMALYKLPLRIDPMQMGLFWLAAGLLLK